MSYNILRRLGQYENERRVRPAGSTVVCCFSLNCSRRITAEHVADCLEYWRKTYQLLRVCFAADAEGEYCFQEIDPPIDFQQVDGHWIEVYNDLLTKEFDEGGLLWRARLVRQNNEHRRKKYVCHLLLSLHHAITDGTSNLVLGNRLMEILDGTFGETKLCSTSDDIRLLPPLEELVPPSGNATIQSVPQERDVEKKTCAWSRAFPVVDENKFETRLVKGGFLDAESTRSLIQRCKTEGATVTAAVATAINFAIYDHYIKKGRIRSGDALPLRWDFDVNMRRFMEEKTAIGLYKQSTNLSHSVRGSSVGEFWGTAKRTTTAIQEQTFSDELRYKLHNGLCLDKVVAMSKAQMQSLVCQYDYILSSMGDVEPIFSGAYTNFEVTSFNYSTKCLDHGVPFEFCVETFRDKLGVNADCIPRLISEGDTRDILVRILYTLKTVTAETKMPADFVR